MHDWPQLPDRFTWQTTHNVAVDKAGNLYVIHEGRADAADHPWWDLLEEYDAKRCFALQVAIDGNAVTLARSAWHGRGHDHPRRRSRA